MLRIAASPADLTSKKQISTLTIKASDVALLRNMFKDLIRGRSNSVNMSELLVSIEHSGPAYDSLKVLSRRLFKNKDRSLHHGQLTFFELLASIYPDAHPIQIQQLIRQVAPSLQDAESDVDTKVQDELDRLGEPTILTGETKQSRRIRLAISRTLQLPTVTPTHESVVPGPKEDLSANIPIVKNIHKPIIRVVFHKRSQEARRLKEYSAVGRPLLTMDGLPLHSNPSLQLQSGNDNVYDDSQNEEVTGELKLKRSNSRSLWSGHRNERRGGPALRRDERDLSISRHSSRNRSSKPQIGSSYAHLFHRPIAPESELTKLACHIDNNSVEQAATLLQQLISRKFVIDPATLRSVMVSAIKNERPDISVQCFLRATTVDGDPGGAKHPACADVDQACYNTLIEAYGCAGNLQAAANVKELMNLNRVLPNGETYNSWIRAAIMNDDIKMTRALMHEMDHNGWSHTISRDIKHALGEETIQDIMENRVSGHRHKEQTRKKFLQIPYNKKYDLIASKLPLNHILPADNPGQNSLNDTCELQQNLSERIETLKLALQVLDDETNGDRSERVHILSRLTALKKELEVKVSKNITQTQESPSSPCTSCREQSEETVPEVLCPIDLTCSKHQSLSVDSKDASVTIMPSPESSEKELKPGNRIKVLLKPLACQPRSFSDQISFVVKRPPYLITKTITATPKSYSSGEFTVVVTLMLNEQVVSRHGDSLTIDIKGFSDLPADDCDLLIFGIGKRLCVDGGAKWIKSTGCISIEIADDAILPSDNSTVFRFSLNVDTKKDHPSVTPTIALYNKSGSFIISASNMDGEILQFSSSSSNRKKKSPSAFDSEPDNSKPSQNSIRDEEREPSFVSEPADSEKLDSKTQNFVDWGSNLGTGEIKKQAYCLDRGFVNSWRPHIVKVFFCALLDMQAEREQLVSRICPTLQQLCETAHIRFIWVDLRAGLTSSENMHTWTMKLRLDEASLCHYFICMIGEDYGWYQPTTTPPDFFDEALREIHDEEQSRSRMVVDQAKKLHEADCTDNGPSLHSSNLHSPSQKPRIQTIASRRMFAAAQRIASGLSSGHNPLVRQNSFTVRIKDVSKAAMPFSPVALKALSSPLSGIGASQTSIPPDSLLTSAASPERDGFLPASSKNNLEPTPGLKRELPALTKPGNPGSDLILSADAKADSCATALPVLVRHELIQLKRSTSSAMNDASVPSASTGLSTIAKVITNSTISNSRLSAAAKQSRVTEVQIQDTLEPTCPGSRSTISGDSEKGRPLLLEEKLHDLACLSKLPLGSDINFILNQLHAMKHGHMWIKSHTDSGLLELEILHRLRLDISSQHRCLMFIRLDVSIPESDPEKANCANDVSMKKGTVDATSHKKLLKLKKKLKSGEYGKGRISEYADPKTGAELISSQLERLLSVDWLSGRSRQIQKINLNLLKLDEPHRSFAMSAAAGCFNLHVKQERTLSVWMERWDTDSPFVLHGAPGSGRSAFLARLWKNESEMKRWDSSVIHFAEVDSSGIRAIIRCCAALSTAFSNLESLPGKFTEICAVFADAQVEEASAVLSKASKVLLVLDSINDLVDENGSSVILFEHLPKKLSCHVKIVMSIASDRGLLSWPITHQWSLCELPALSKNDTVQLISEYLKFSQRQSKESHLLELFSNDSGHNALQARVVSLSLFTFCHYDFVLEGSGQALCGDSISLVWGKIIRSLEHLHGGGIVRVILISLSLCQDGISMDELLNLVQFAEGRMPGESVKDLAYHSSKNPLIITAVLWPFKKSQNIWLRYNLNNVRSYLKTIFDKYYLLDSPDQSVKRSWHTLLANFFFIPGTNPQRVMREYPYHLMKANDNEKLKQFLSHPQWCIEMVSSCLCNDLFLYWRSTGKTWLSNSYTRALFRPQCWGCACQRNQTETWVEDFIKQGQAMDLKITRIADSLEKEIVQKTGKKYWLREDILEHIRFHSSGGKPPLLHTPLINPVHYKTSSEKDIESENIIDWDDKKSAHALRIIYQILRDSIDRVTIPSIKKLKEGRVRISKAEEMEKIIPRELSKLQVLNRILLTMDSEQTYNEVKSPLSEDFLAADSCEVNVSSISDLGITGKANFPFTMKIGDEVMTATKVEGSTLTVIRNNHRKQTHECYFMVNFLFRLPSKSKQESLSNLKDQFAELIGGEVGRIKILKAELKQTAEKHFDYNEDEFEWRCGIQCCSEFEAEQLQDLIERSALTKKTQQDRFSSSLAFEFELVDGPTQAYYRPHVYAEVAVPNRLIALDHYWSAHIADAVGDRQECEAQLNKCIQILEHISYLSDHLLVQCKVYLWLIFAEHGNRRIARERAQALIIFEKEWLKPDTKSQSRSLSASKSSRNLFNLTREADDIMHGDQIKFQEKVGRIRCMLTPCTLHEIESATYLRTKAMWLSVFIDEARDLLPMDLNGSDDPFCSVSLSNETKSTKIHLRTLNVRFDEELLFSHVQPDPDSIILIDVWDWDGPGRQDLIGFAQLSLKAALVQEGETMVFTLNRHHRGRGVQAEGIKVGTSGSCGYISLRFHFSFTLRQALINCRQRFGTQVQEAIQHRVESSEVRQHEYTRNITLLEPETWDETLPVSSSDESAWISRISFLNEIGSTEEITRQVAINSALSYYKSCKDLHVYPRSELLEYIESFVSGEASPALSLSSFVGEDGLASIIAAMTVVEQLSCISCLELGSCKISGNVANKIFPSVARQKTIQSLFVQSNMIGDSTVGIDALISLFSTPSTPCMQHLVVLCLAQNSLQAAGIAKLLLCISCDSSLLSLDLSHNNSRNLGAVAIAYFLRHNTTLKELNCAWNQIGSDPKYASSTKHRISVKEKLLQDGNLHTVTMSTERNCKELLLSNDTDGRWARHILQDNKELSDFAESLALVFKLCDLGPEVESFLSEYTNYLNAANAVKHIQDLFGAAQKMNSGLVLNDVEAVETGNSTVISNQAFTDSPFTPEMTPGLLQSSIDVFQLKRDSVFKSRDVLLKALESQSRTNEASMAVSELRSVISHPMFWHFGATANSSALLTIFTALEHNTALEFIDLSWNKLGNVDAKSMDVCSTIATCFSAPTCCLKAVSLAHNNICFLQSPQPSLQMFVDSLLSSNSLQQVTLDGNRIGESICHFLGLACSSSSIMKISFFNCCKDIVHPIQFNMKHPFGKYALEMEDLASRNLVRSLISLVCRQQGKFKGNQVQHSTHEGTQIRKFCVTLPDTEFMKWKDWHVPTQGTVSFEFTTTDTSIESPSMPHAEFQSILHSFKSEISTQKRKAILLELSKTKYLLSSQQEMLLSSCMRDFPERCYFLAVTQHPILDHVENNNENG